MSESNLKVSAIESYVNTTLSTYSKGCEERMNETKSEKRKAVLKARKETCDAIIEQLNNKLK